MASWASASFGTGTGTGTGAGRVDARSLRAERDGTDRRAAAAGERADGSAAAGERAKGSPAALVPLPAWALAMRASASGSPAFAARSRSFARFFCCSRLRRNGPPGLEWAFEEAEFEEAEFEEAEFEEAGLEEAGEGGLAEAWFGEAGVGWVDGVGGCEAGR